MLFGLALGSSLSTTGCLVADAPTYGPPQKRPPVIDSQNVEPSPYEVVVFPPRSPAKTFTVPVRSEDAGEDLVGTLVVDWRLPSQEQVADQAIPASTFDKTDRKYQVSWRPDQSIQTGCGHTLTALIMHEENFDDGPDLPKPDAEDWDIASVTWQLNVEPTTQGVIETCPPEEGL